MVTATYDHEGDVIHIVTGGDGPEKGEEVSPGVMLLYDGVGRLIGIERQQDARPRRARQSAGRGVRAGRAAARCRVAARERVR